MLFYHLRLIYLPLFLKNFEGGLEFVCANNDNNSRNFVSKLGRDLGRHEKLLEPSRTFEELWELLPRWPPSPRSPRTPATPRPLLVQNPCTLSTNRVQNILNKTFRHYFSLHSCRTDFALRLTLFLPWGFTANIWAAAQDILNEIVLWFLAM